MICGFHNPNYSRYHERCRALKLSRARAAKAMRDAGKTYRVIGEILGVSGTRAHQMVAWLERYGDTPLYAAWPKADLPAYEIKPLAAARLVRRSLSRFIRLTA